MANPPEVLRDVLANRIRKNQKHLQKWAKRERVSCYRVYDRDIPEIPITLDLYEDDLVLNDFRASDRGGGEPWLEAMVAGARDALEPREIFVKQRERLGHRGDGQQYEREIVREQWRTVIEGGHRFKVNLSDYIDTGLFLDHRTTRRVVAAETAKTCLNLFAYTGSFSVYTAAAGMAVTTVDLSNTYLDWARENFALNKLTTGEFIRADVREFLAEARAANKKWDLVIADVPTFSNSKSMAYTWDVQRDHAALLADLAAITSGQGAIWFATNSQRFKFNYEPTDRSTDEMSYLTVPTDFRDRKIHRTFRVSRAPHVRRA